MADDLALEVILVLEAADLVLGPCLSLRLGDGSCGGSSVISGRDDKVGGVREQID